MALVDWDDILLWLKSHPGTPRHLIEERECELRDEERRLQNLENVE